MRAPLPVQMPVDIAGNALFCLSVGLARSGRRQVDRLVGPFALACFAPLNAGEAFHRCLLAGNGGKVGADDAPADRPKRQAGHPEALKAQRATTHRQAADGAEDEVGGAEQEPEGQHPQETEQEAQDTHGDRRGHRILTAEIADVNGIPAEWR